MVEAWTSGVGAQLAGPGAVTILHGTTYVLAAANGDMDAARPHGFFFRDTRFISGWRLRLNGKELESLYGSATEPYRAMFVGRPAVDGAGPESHVLIERHRSLDGGFTERIVVHNHSSSEFSAALELDVEADFADLFDVKGGARRPRAAAARHAGPDGFSYSCEQAGHTLEVIITAYFRDVIGPELGGGIEYVGEVGQQEKYRLLGGAVALLNPIQWSEPFGMVMIEAMATGTPVVSTSRGSAPEIVQDGVTGFIRDTGASLALALGQCGTLERAAARRSTETKFSAARMVGEHVEIYQRSLSDRCVSDSVPA
ncbi:glycogen debranching N-terminal domain-containing protein [Paeniglutamicibacter gangotriensis]|uniref:Glycosyl transferase family 4 n=1 Tax=Paeniglutamicibacter gangotriensis Lz1y TaxID=1276920 RepID=M7MXY1_9MICC|nr:glycogen debranching N-terminal domain-containing protein [Paeniglutamicibacter gangotriensis]EMQ99926.1 glycosyl transferase family 4 [Paeniglutamicibacter gangotriensis Lz1y]